MYLEVIFFISFDSYNSIFTCKERKTIFVWANSAIGEKHLLKFGYFCYYSYKKTSVIRRANNFFLFGISKYFPNITITTWIIMIIIIIYRLISVNCQSYSKGNNSTSKVIRILGLGNGSIKIFHLSNYLTNKSVINIILGNSNLPFLNLCVTKLWLIKLEIGVFIWTFLQWNVCT